MESMQESLMTGCERECGRLEITLGFALWKEDDSGMKKTPIRSRPVELSGSDRLGQGVTWETVTVALSSGHPCSDAVQILRGGDAPCSAVHSNCLCFCFVFFHSRVTERTHTQGRS